MTRSPHELGHLLDQLDSGSGSNSAPIDVDVAWKDADPESRPTGMAVDVNEDGDELRLAYDVWEAQRETLDQLESGSNDLVAFLGGFGSGKSVLGARWLLSEALANPGSKFLCLGVDFRKSRDTTYPKLFAALPGDRTTVLTSGFNGPENSVIVEDYNRQSRRLTLTNDSVIILGSASEASRYAGAEFGSIWCDEPSHYRDLHDLTSMLVSRLRGADGSQQMLWTTTGNGYNACWEILEKRRDGDGDPLGLEIEVIRASVLDNPYLDDAEKDRFRRKFGNTDREDQALHGGWAAAEGLVYSNFSRDVHVISHSEALERVGDRRTYGYDAGWSDPRVVVELGETSYGQLVVVDEWRKEESHVEAAIEWLESGKRRGTIYAEHEPSDVRKFEQAGWPAKKADKALDAGISEVRERFGTDADGRPGLLISQNCGHLIRELQGYKEEDVGSSSAEDHLIDAMRYAVFTPVASPATKRRTRRGTPDELSRSRGETETTESESSGTRRVVNRKSPGGGSSQRDTRTDAERKRRAAKKKRAYWNRRD